MNAISLGHVDAATTGRYSHVFTDIRQWRPALGTETIALLASLYFSLFCNAPFWRAVIAAHPLDQLSNGLFLGLCFVSVTAVHFVLLCLVATRLTFKPVLSVLLLATALAVYYMGAYSVFLDSTMLRNVLHTEPKEARELLTPGMFAALASYTGIPMLLLWRTRIKPRSWPRAILMRGLCLAAGTCVAVAAVWINYPPLAAFWRNEPEARFLVTPGNFIASTRSVLFADARERNRVRKPVGTDAVVAARTNAKPRLLVIVVGETVRAANWGLNGYARQTTPGLAALDVVNFPDVSACGSNTEVSVPCMFSMIGRRDYDERRIRGEESLLHVLEHAGVKTLWRDNQTGCKGVCQGLAFEQLNDSTDPALCKDGLCLDEILLGGLEQKIEATPGDMVVVLHQLGNHGPSYYLRYPPSLRRFAPTCDTAELGSCTLGQVVNSYDNATLYTDHFLARTIERLQQQTTHDAAMIYLSDHGESLGENGLYLHGLPYAITPAQQTKVPMTMWFSPAYARNEALDLACLRGRAAQPASHDNLFHSVLGMLDVSTQAYEASLDVFAGCRRS